MTKNLTLTGFIVLGLMLGFPGVSRVVAKTRKDVVTTGVAIRGITLKDPIAVGTDCANFKDEHVDSNGNMTDASVQCLPGGNLDKTLKGIPDRFNYVCVLSNLKRLGTARLIQAPVKENANHCSLSAIKPAEAQRLFGGAMPNSKSR